MFGGYGISHRGLTFGIVVDDVLYLKADVDSAPDFERQGLPRFAYDKGGKTVEMSYYQAPDVILDDPEAAAGWARRSYAAAVRAAAKKGKGKAK